MSDTNPKCHHFFCLEVYENATEDMVADGKACCICTQHKCIHGLTQEDYKRMDRINRGQKDE